jgi:hypothetical protein
VSAIGHATRPGLFAVRKRVSQVLKAPKVLESKKVQGLRSRTFTKLGATRTKKPRARRYSKGGA